jgi:aspartokinase-like uncharacterized kinase
MNRERAINILLEHAIRSTDPNDDAYAVESDSLTAAILFMQKEIEKNKIDAKVQIQGISSNIKKGI